MPTTLLKPPRTMTKEDSPKKDAPKCHDNCEGQKREDATKGEKKEDAPMPVPVPAIPQE